MLASDLFQFPASLPFAQFFPSNVPPWEWVSAIHKALEDFNFSIHKRNDIPTHLFIEGNVYLHETVKLPPYGYIQGPAYIGANCELRPGVYIRGNVIVGENCVLGNSCEYKNCLLMDHVQTPHFNYVGDSILGSRSHLAAGVILANQRLDKEPITINFANNKIPTYLKKLGSMIAESVEVGCNTVLQPGTILSKNVIVGSCVALGGFVKENQKVFAQKPILSDSQKV